MVSESEAPPSPPPPAVIADILFGTWRAQTLHAAVKVGLFETMSLTEPKSIVDIAKEAGVDQDMAYRVLRALAPIGIVHEIGPSSSESPRRQASQFQLTTVSDVLRKDHPGTMRGMVLFESGREQTALWKHLPNMIKDGKQNAFVREYGVSIFDYAKENADYNQLFNTAMNSYSNLQAENVFHALKDLEYFREIETICDVAGGYGSLLSKFLKDRPYIPRGIVFELPNVVNDTEQLCAKTFGVEDRIDYVGGDMFESVPPADAYILKMIIHDWNDEECLKILTNIHKAATSPTSKLFVCEHVVPGPNEPGFGNLFDIDMVCCTSGRERTADEHTKLLQDAGWTQVKWHKPEGGRPVSIMEATRG